MGVGVGGELVSLFLSPVKGQPLAELVPEDEGADSEQRGAPAARSRSWRGREGVSRRRRRPQLRRRLRGRRRRGSSSKSGSFVVFGGCRPIQSRHPEERGFPLHLFFLRSSC